MTQGRWLVKAEPLQSITDRNYFVKAVQACEAALSPAAGAGANDAEHTAQLQACRAEIMQLQVDLGLITSL